MLITAKDLMRKSCPTLTFDTSVSEAVQFFARTASSFALVVAGESRIQGVLTEASMLRIFLHHQAPKAPDELIHYRNMFEPVQLVLETEVFDDVFRKILAAVGNRVFVIDRHDNLIGFIQIKDIWSQLAEGSARDKQALTAPEHSTDHDPMIRLEEQLKTLRNEVFYFSSFFEKSPFMMHSADSTGKIQMANEMLHQALGYDYGDLIGKTIFDIYPPENHESAREGLKKIMSEGYHEPVQGQMVTRRKRLLDVELSSRALREPVTKTHLGTITISRPLNMKAHLAMLEERES